jgi:Kef-type K+ transport system membrane component KefB
MSEPAVALHSDPSAPVILGATSILAFAVAGRVGARKLGQPTVLGELLMGVLAGGDINEEVGLVFTAIGRSLLKASTGRYQYPRTTN